MKNLKLILTLLLIGGGALSPAATRAQSAESRTMVQGVAASQRNQEPGEDSLRVFTLTHASAAQTSRVIQRLLPHCRIGVDERTNSIAVLGQAFEHQYIAELLNDLDVDHQDEALKSYVQTVRRVPRHEALQALVSDRARIAIDHDARLVVVHGTDQDIAEVSKVVAAMNDNSDAADSSLQQAGKDRVQVNVYFITMKAGSSPDARKATNLPARLEPVWDALADHGYQQPELLAWMMVHTRLDHEFDMVGSAGESSGGSDIYIDGSAYASAAIDGVELDFSTKLLTPKTDAPDSPVDPQTFEVSTHVTAPWGQYVVLAASPSKSEMFDALAVVVQVESKP